MSKSIKPGDNTYIDSTGIVHEHELLSNLLTKLTYIRKYGLWPSSTNKIITTDIPVSGVYGGKTILAIISGHVSSGDSTFSSIYMIRCGYDNNNVTTTQIASNFGNNVGSGGISFEANSNGNLVMKTTLTSGNINVLFITNK